MITPFHKLHQHSHDQLFNIITFFDDLRSIERIAQKKRRIPLPIFIMKTVKKSQIIIRKNLQRYPDYIHILNSSNNIWMKCPVSGLGMFVENIRIQIGIVIVDKSCLLVSDIFLRKIVFPCENKTSILSRGGKKEFFRRPFFGKNV